MIHMAKSIEKLNNNGSPNQINTPFFSHNLVKACGVPPHYLYKILSKLVHADILSARPGKKGGYTFKKKADDLTLYEIIEPFENLTEYSNCFCEEHICTLYGKKSPYKTCPLHPIFKQSVIEIFSRLKSITLRSLIDNTPDDLKTSL